MLLGPIGVCVKATLSPTLAETAFLPRFQLSTSLYKLKPCDLYLRTSIAYKFPAPAQSPLMFSGKIKAQLSWTFWLEISMFFINFVEHLHQFTSMKLSITVRVISVSRIKGVYLLGELWYYGYVGVELFEMCMDSCFLKCLD